MSECYQATFRWPRRDASNVIITGSFDGWSCSRYLTKSNSGFFEGIVQIPWGEKVAYKYIVDGRWTTTDDRPTEMDNEGNLNNVYRAPARPESPFKVTPIPTPAPAPAPAPEAVTETKAQTGQAESGSEGSSVGAVGAVGAVTAAVVGVVETAKQAAVDMVEAMAPGTTDTPAATPVVETPKPEPTPAPEATQVLEATPAPAPSEPTPAPVPEPSQPEVAATDTTAAVLPSEPAPVAPIVPVTILPLSTEPASESVTAPLADVSESKPLDTTVVEGTSTADTSSPPEAASAPAPEDAPSTHVPAPANATVDEKPPTDIAGPSEEKTPATNGTGPSEDKPAVNGTPAVSGTEEPKPAADGPTPTTTKPEPAAVNGAEQAAPVNGKTAPTPTTPTKKTRFPSLSSRSSKHSRTRSSAEATGTSPSTGHGASELGERKEQGTNGDGKDTVSSRFTASQRKKRTSIFGKIKDVFSHHKNEPPPSAQA